MQLTSKLKNKSTVWAASLRPRVGDVISSGGVYYCNITGYNGAVSNTLIWFPIGATSGGTELPITKTSTDITGADPFFSLNLSATSIPALPANMLVYVDLNGDGNPQILAPLQYNAGTKILNGMSDPAGFPSQIIKIFAY